MGFPAVLRSLRRYASRRLLSSHPVDYLRLSNGDRQNCPRIPKREMLQSARTSRLFGVPGPFSGDLSHLRSPRPDCDALELLRFAIYCRPVFFGSLDR